MAFDASQGSFCLRCNAWLGCLGLEPTPDLYIAHLVEVFREVRRVLRKDGVVFLNLGDSFANDGKWGGHTGGKHALALHGQTGIGRERRHTALKPKDLCMIPARVALALQADGWWVRSNIIWHKNNPMPESVTDRPTSSHEHIFLLAKAERYYYDSDAVREELSPLTLADKRNATGRHTQGDQRGSKYGGANAPDEPSWYRSKTFVNPGTGRNLRDVWYMDDEGRVVIHAPRPVLLAFARYWREQHGDWPFDKTEEELAASPRYVYAPTSDVWTMSTAPYPDAHFATFPPELPRKCILAGSPPKVCATCGAPWKRVVEKKGETTGRHYENQSLGEKRGIIGAPHRAWKGGDVPVSQHNTIGWRPTCAHYDHLYFAEFPQARSPRKRYQRWAWGDWQRRVRKQPGHDHWETRPPIILDPFMGSGTTLMVAEELGRWWIGIDISEEYAAQARRRTAQRSLGMEAE